MSANRKIWMLMAGCFLAFLLSYKFAFEKTILLAKEVSQLEQKAIGLSELASLNMQLSQREKQVDSILSSNNLKNTSIQNGLLNFLNDQKANSSIQIVAFEEPHRFESENGVLVSYSFNLTGDYDDILNLVYKLEQELSFGSVTSLKLKTKRDYKTRRTLLHCNIIIENVTSRSSLD